MTLIQKLTFWHHQAPQSARICLVRSYPSFQRSNTCLTLNFKIQTRDSTLRAAWTCGWEPKSEGPNPVLSSDSVHDFSISIFQSRFKFKNSTSDLESKHGLRLRDLLAWCISLLKASLPSDTLTYFGSDAFQRNGIVSSVLGLKSNSSVDESLKP